MSLIHYWRLAALIALAACSGGQPNGEGDEPSAPVAVIESASEDYMAENSEPSLPPTARMILIFVQPFREVNSLPTSDA